jgi:hypothetical protein
VLLKLAQKFTGKRTHAGNSPARQPNHFLRTHRMLPLVSSLYINFDALGRWNASAAQLQIFPPV